MTPLCDTTTTSPDLRASTLWRHPTALVFVVALIVYVVSLAPGPLWQDSGMAQVRTVRGDIEGSLGLALSHPLYYRLTELFQWFPAGSPAWRTNLVSAVFGAATAAGVFLFLHGATKRRLPAAIGAISLGVAHTFWQHCALAEVYTVSTALMVGELLCLQRFLWSRHSAWLIALMLLSGLGVSNHMLAVLSLPCYAIAIVSLIVRREVRLRAVPLLALAWIAGAAIYLSLILAHLRLGEPAATVVRSALFGHAYESNVLNVVPSLRQLINSALYMGMNFPTPVAALAVVGVLVAWRKPRRLDLTVCLAMWVVHLVFAVRYDVPDQYTFFIPGIVLTALLIGLGADRVTMSSSRRRSALVLCLALMPVAVYVPLPSISKALGIDLGTQREIPYRDARRYFLHPWKTGEDGPLLFARHLSDLLPPDAVLIADGTTVRPLHYLRLTSSWRPDVLLYPPIEENESTAARFEPGALAEALDDGRVYVVTPQRSYCPAWLVDGYRFERAGLIHRVVQRK